MLTYGCSLDGYGFYHCFITRLSCGCLIVLLTLAFQEFSSVIHTFEDIRVGSFLPYVVQRGVGEQSYGVKVCGL